MTEPTIDRLEPRVGETIETVTGLTVEAGKVAEFAAAVGDDDPVYRDPEVAARRGHERVPAPPTFTRVGTFPRYRPEGDGSQGFDLGFDPRYELHGEQAYEFERPVYVGDTLTGRTTLTDAYEREGEQGGTMTFAVLETTYEDADDETVLTERGTVIESDGEVSSDGHGDLPERGADPGRATVRLSDGNLERTTSTADVAEGDEGPTLVVEGLAPQDFVRYAGASGDFNPIHYDSQFARAAGNERVFGQGMLTAGYAGRLLTDWFGVGALRRFRARFTARVWPGDTLTVTGSVTDVDDDEVAVDLSATRQTGEAVLLGDAVASPSEGSGEGPGE
jgi:acyl dehydratase